MSAQHTPGPWSVTPRFGHFIDVIHHSQEKGAITRVLCRVQARQTWRDEAEANARLIAAAPELLDHCKRALDAWTGDGHPIFLDDLRAVIAKATGTDK